MKLLPVSLVRQVDVMASTKFGMHSLVLMENAGISSCNSICNFLDRSHTQVINGHDADETVDAVLQKESAEPCSPVSKIAIVLCGAGNNGGDGLVIARHLELRDWSVIVWMLGGVTKLSDDCQANFVIANAAGIPIRVFQNLEASNRELNRDLEQATVIIDAMLGTGAHGDPRSPFAEAIEAANQIKAVRVAVDVPTGLDAETGIVGKPTFQADLTCTFVAGKIGFQSPIAQKFLGQVDVCSIGVPKVLLDEIFCQVKSVDA